jgi:2-dehydro-3-deoxyphosphooctonate aldolase (KDO 8-P synthase)
METHPNPAQALSDGPNSWPLHLVQPLLEQLQALDEISKSRPFLEDSFDSE